MNMMDFDKYVVCQMLEGYQNTYIFKTKAKNSIWESDIVFAEDFGYTAFVVRAVYPVERDSDADIFIRASCENKNIRSLTGKVLELDKAVEACSIEENED